MHRLKKFSIAQKATPILDTPHFTKVFGGEDGNSLPLDSQKLLRRLSAVAFPDTKFELIKHCSEFIYKVRAKDHPLKKLYVDCRFLEEVEPDYPERSKTLPTRTKIIERLESIVGAAFIWGGNWSWGIPEMRLYYPPKMKFEKLDPVLQKTWIMEGVDCSGLLFQVTDGITPGATSLMTDYGKPVRIEGKGKKELMRSLKPLDLIIFPNHVVVVVDQGNVIESRGGKGVIKTTIEECYEDLLVNRSGFDDWRDAHTAEKPYIVRRWHPEAISKKAV